MTSKLGNLPEGVDSAMFLRDGWPDACVCKVVMKDGRVGIGLHRPLFPPVHPEEFDAFALADAIANVSDAPPDYTPLHEHVQKMAAEAVRRSDEMHPNGRHSEGGESLAHDEEETDHDLQASLGQKAHD